MRASEKDAVKEQQSAISLAMMMKATENLPKNPNSWKIVKPGACANSVYQALLSFYAKLLLWEGPGDKASYDASSRCYRHTISRDIASQPLFSCSERIECKVVGRNERILVKQSTVCGHWIQAN